MAGKRDSAYYAARLERDFPRLWKQVQDGKLSVRAASIRAGLKRERTALMELQNAWLKLSATERRAARIWLVRAGMKEAA